MGQVQLEDVYEEIRENPRWDHLRQPGIVLVKGRGQSHPSMCRAMIVGEAPGATENTKRRPFCGPSGRVLNGLMGLASLSAEDDACTGGCGDQHAQYDCPNRTDVPADSFITNVVKYRPPGNRTPTVGEILLGAEALRKEWMAIGRPKLIVAVGATARTALSPVERGRMGPGTWATLPDGRTTLWVQYHPAWGLRQGNKGRETMERHWEEMGEWIREYL